MRTTVQAGSAAVGQLPPEPGAHRAAVLHGDPEAGLTARARPEARPEARAANLRFHAPPVLATARTRSGSSPRSSSPPGSPPP